MAVPLDVRRVAAARLWAAARMPYLASALFASTVRSAPGTRTIAVDRAWHVHADPELVAGLEVEQLGRLLVHLAGHLIRDHADRARTAGVDDDRAARWNRCADAEINDDLVVTDCVPAVASEHPGDLGCAIGLLAERYFVEAVDGPRRWDCGSGADGRARPWDCDGGVPRGQGDLLRLGVAAAIQRHAAREPGSVAGGWMRWADAVLPSRIDWRRALAGEIRRALAFVAGCADYTYMRPSRRARASPRVVLPSLVQPVPDVAIVCDTSGSMHERLLARALAEIEALLTRAGLRRAQVRVLAVDTAVHATRRVSRASQVVLAGGGGTDMGAGIAAAAVLRPRPSIVIVLTDGFTPWPEAPPRGVRVVVGLLRSGVQLARWPAPSWARVIEIEDDAA